jgi:hypothetical protein
MVENQKSQMTKPKKPNINIPNQFRALAELLLNKSIPPAAVTENGNRRGMRFIWSILVLSERVNKIEIEKNKGK